ncbi:hypothetical protein D3C71_1638540 [compost metagenome]
MLRQSGSYFRRVVPLAAADIQQRLCVGCQRLIQQLGYPLLQRPIKTAIQERAPRLHHFRTVAGLLRTLVLYRQQVDVALFGAVKLMVSVATPLR